VADVLDEVLRSAQDLGFLGPRPISGQRRHAEGLCALALRGLEVPSGGEFLDLGSGAGLPGLVLALTEGGPARGVLLDAQHRRTAFLAAAVERLGLADRIDVITGRAEDVARDPAHRERYALVVSRGFGAPAVTAECAVAFLAPGARLAVSEPPDENPDRWNEEALIALGLSAPELTATADTHAALFHRTGPLLARWPRKRGIPQKRPLWQSST
jgi:16S rRNA (guanine527-N7)-methyltransferase